MDEVSFQNSERDCLTDKEPTHLRLGCSIKNLVKVRVCCIVAAGSKMSFGLCFVNVLIKKGKTRVKRFSFEWIEQNPFANHS